ncbi:MAG: hypothetical protein Q8903_10485 [Bacteroidota bacterium]|nr:hypothetical protein [Bacteroidota bacterium]
MTKLSALLIVISITVVFGQTKNDPYRYREEKHLKNIKMLTNAGQNAEAYLSFDNKKLIYQSNDDNLPCDQIFIMDLKGKGKHMVSTGLGATTCSYFLPGNKTIIYSSTHGADKNCPPKADRSKGYVWKLYDTFKIYKADSSGKNIVCLTEAPGYNAEATVSPKGDKIVFTSTRDGDPEIYTMNIDGSDQKRLTFEKGYDGGAFFSADGSKIVFRASRPKTEQELKDYEELVKDGLVRPTALEICVMDADGKNIKQLTHFGKASFAPFFFPDGKRIIFASNMNADKPMNFNLYKINTDGTGLEQITFDNSFNSFPMFTKNGKKLIFGSNRFNKKPHDTNVFIADWVE